MSWISGSLDPPRKIFPTRAGVLRKSGNNPSLNGSILDDNSIIDPNKRESQWWKRLNSEEKNSSADFFPISKNIDFTESQISIQPEESMEYQSHKEDEVNFSTISSLNLSLSTRPLFKKGGQKDSSLEINQPRSSFDNQKIINEKILFKNKLSEIETVNYKQAILSSNSPTRLDFHSENEDDEIPNEPKKSLFRKSEMKRKNGRSVFADALRNQSASYASDVVEHDFEDTVTNVAELRPKKSLFDKATMKNAKKMSVFAERSVNLSDPPTFLTIQNASENFLESLSGEEKKQKLFKMTNKKERTERKKSVFAEALSNDCESDKSNINEHTSYVLEKSHLHSVNDKSVKSQEMKKNLFKNAGRINAGGKSVFAQALNNDSEFDTILDLPEPVLKKQKFSENTEITTKTNINVIPHSNIDKAEQVEKIYPSKTPRKSLLMKSRRQSDNDRISMKSEHSPISIISETMNFEMWKQVASSTMIESPKTPWRDTARASRNLLPVRSSMHPDISEEKEGSHVIVNMKNDLIDTESIREQIVKNILQPNCKNEAQSAIIDDCIPKETVKNISSTSTTPKANIYDENNISTTRKSIRISQKSDLSNKRSFAKELGVDEMEGIEKSPLKNAKQLTEQSHLIEKDILNVGSPENSPQPLTFEMSKRQSVGTWLKLQESEPDTVPILNQSYIDKQVMEEIMAKRTNPPVRRSTHKNFNGNDSIDRTQGDGNSGSPINNSAEMEKKKYTVRHSNINNLAGPINELKCLESSGKAIMVTPQASPTPIKDESNLKYSENKSITRNDEGHVSLSNLIEADNDSKKENYGEAISAEADKKSKLQQNNKSLLDDEISNHENIFTPRSDLKKSNILIAENSNTHNLDKSIGNFMLNELADTSYTKNTLKSKFILQADMTQSTNNSAREDTLQDSESDVETSEELFDGVKDSVELNKNFKVRNLHKTMSPITLEISVEKTEEHNCPQNNKRLSKNVSTSKKTINNKENAPLVCISQTDIKKHLEKLEHENVERKKKAEEFSKHFLSRKIFHLKPTVEKKKLSFKLNKNYTKQTAPKDMLDKRETGINSKKKKSKSKLYLKEQWITSHLRSFVERKLEPRYGYKTNIRTEKFIKDLVQIVRLVEDAKSDFHQYVDTLKSEMASLEIIKTHFEFYRFIQVYLPYSFRIRSVPACGRSVPNLKEGLFTEIAIDDKV